MLRNGISEWIRLAISLCIRDLAVPPGWDRGGVRFEISQDGPRLMDRGSPAAATPYSIQEITMAAGFQVVGTPAL